MKKNVFIDIFTFLFSTVSTNLAMVGRFAADCLGVKLFSRKNSIREFGDGVRFIVM